MTTLDTYASEPTLATPFISGNHLARAKKLTKRQRAELAVDIMEGWVALGPLTDAQIARICGISPSYTCRVKQERAAVAAAFAQAVTQMAAE
jgi:hypothetical protein